MHARDSVRRSGTRSFLSVLAIGCTAVALLPARPQQPESPKATNILVGRVIDTGTGAPVPDAIVTLSGIVQLPGQPARLPNPVDFPDAARPRNVMTTANGDFMFRDVPAGRYAIASMAFGYVNETYPLRIVEVASSDRPTTITLRARRFAAVAGTVFDDRGEPIAGVTVTALERLAIGGRFMLRQTFTEAVTDDRGEYRLAQLPPGRYVVGVLASTTSIPSSLAAEFDAAASNPQAVSEIRRRLTPSGGPFTIGEGMRIGDAVLQWTGLMPPPAADGSLQSYVTTLFPGTSNVEEATAITLESGEQRTGVDLSLRVTRTVRVSGVVTGPNGPIRNLNVRLISPNAADYVSSLDAAGLSSAITDDHGAFTFLAIAPGEYTLKITLIELDTTTSSCRSCLWTEQPLTVGDAEIIGLALTMRPGIRVSGRIEFKGSGTKPQLPARSSINLRPVGAQVWRPGLGRLAADGTFVTGGDPPGRYIVNVPYLAGWSRQSITRDGRLVADDVIELVDSDIAGLVVTYSDRPTIVTGSVVDAKGIADADSDVIVFPADTTLWREGIINDRRVRMTHVTSRAAFEFVELPTGEYYLAAVREASRNEGEFPQFLERLIAGATKITLAGGEQRAVQLKSFTPREK
jgi:hypothetical protein